MVLETRSLITLAAMAFLGCSSGRIEKPGPVSAEKSLTLFQLDPQLRIELFAAEPYVRDPVDLVFDEDGRAFVAEMLDYPSDSASAPRSRIRLLMDDDADGRIDGAVVFADSIPQITGLQPWEGGLIVTAAPDILYLRDADGDGRADEKKVLFTGFSLANPQHRVSTPRLALDNWVYVANDGQPGVIRAVDYAEVVKSVDGGDIRDSAVSVLGADFRFRMDRPQFEPASGPAQYGQAFDERGNRFIAHNTIHVRHVVLPREYLARNPFLAARSTAHEISDHGLRVFPTSPPEAWRISRTEIRSRRYQTESLDRTEHARGYFTGVSGGTIYSGSALPAEYAGNLFTGEVTANAIHRDILVPDGPTFVARRAPEEAMREFLTSRDPWFRPVTATVGPDGALYVVDMYREIIESPEYMPEPVREQLDFYGGTERGRIYRIFGVRPSPPRKWPGEAATPELVQSLDDPNQWVRLTSQRILIEQRDQAAIPLLRDLVGTTGMLHALYVLESLEALDERLLRDALRDPSGGVREHALRLAERYAGLADEIIRLVDDPDPRVRFQAVLSLGSFSTSEAVSALARATESGDTWFETAVLTASPELHMRIYQRLVGRDDSIGTGLLRELAAVIGARGDADEIAWVLGHPARAQRLAVLNGLAEGFELAGIRRLEYPKGTLDIAALRGDDPGASERGYLIWDWSEPAAEAVDSKLPIEQRRLAARRLASALFDAARAPMERLLSAGMEEQMIALETLSAFPRRDVAEIILSNWPHLKARETALRVLSSRQTWLKRLQDAIADGTISARELTPQARLILLENPDPSIRPTALLTARSIVNRDSVLARIGNLDAGRGLFYDRCAVCHLGWNALGPDLAGVNNKSREQLLEAILTPSRAIPGTYESYVAVLDDEFIVAGRIVAESPGTLSVRGYEGITTVLRSRIRAIRQSETSMMPDDTASDLSAQELADLISFLRAVPE